MEPSPWLPQVLGNGCTLNRASASSGAVGTTVQARVNVGDGVQAQKMPRSSTSTVCGLHRELNDWTLFKCVKFTAVLWEGGDMETPCGLECVQGIRAGGSETSALPERKGQQPV